MQIEKVTTERFTMKYFRFGEGGNTLVILPGLSIQSVMGAADLVASAYKDLAEKYTIYVFDRKDDIEPPYTVRDMAEDTAEAFKALGLEKTALFGASQGGMMALVIAIEHPELVSKLILGSSSAHVKDEHYAVLEEWIRLAEKGDREGLYLDFGKEIYPPDVFEQYKDVLVESAKTVTDEELRRFIILAEGTKGFDVVDDLGKISCPMLAIGDYRDRVLSADATMEIAEKVDSRPDFRLYMYAGFGHAAFDTAPDYRERMLRFLES